MDTDTIENAEGFIQEFLAEYLSDGIGAKNKREIDILVMNLLMKHAGLEGRSNQELSILLQAPVAKIKGLRYEARLKYPPDQDYIKREFLYLLSRSQFDFEKGKLIFAMEDDFLRHAIQGELKSKGMFADTSFNTELVKIDQGALEAVIGELYGSEIAEDFRIGFEAMKGQIEGEDEGAGRIFSDAMIAFVQDVAIKIGLQLLTSRLGF